MGKEDKPLSSNRTLVFLIGLSIGAAFVFVLISLLGERCPDEKLSRSDLAALTRILKEKAGNLEESSLADEERTGDTKRTKGRWKGRERDIEREREEEQAYQRPRSVDRSDVSERKYEERKYSDERRYSEADRRFGRKQGPPQIPGTSSSTVFIAIASFRDKECAGTLIEMFREAAYPARLHIQIVEHISRLEPLESCQAFYSLARCGERGAETICQHIENIDIVSLPYMEGRGPLDARHEVQRYLRDEEFAMMIDAHTRFAPRWDQVLMDNWNELDDEMAIITTYPHGYEDRNDPLPVRETRSILCNSQFVPGLRIPRHQGGADISETGSKLTPFWSACVSFSKAHAFRAVMFDCCAPYTFEGEEFSYSARLWTHGYDFYTPKDNVLFHQYFHPGVVEKKNKVYRPRYSEIAWNERERIMVESNERIRMMLGMQPMRHGHNGAPIQVNYTNLDVYGLGNVRSREEYMAFSYVDLDSEIAENRCVEIARDVLKRVPLRYVPDLKYEGYTPDPHPRVLN